MRSSIALHDLVTILADLEEDGVDQDAINRFRSAINILLKERRWQRREQRRAEEGSFLGDHGGRLPFGLIRAPQGIFINEEEARVIRHIFALRDTGKTLQAIAKALNDEKTRTSHSGKMWYASSVREILQHETIYRGSATGNAATGWPTILTDDQPISTSISPDRLLWRTGLPIPLPTHPAPQVDLIYHIRISLDEINPEIWRRFAVRADTTLDNFVQILSIAMGWPLGQPFLLTNGDEAYNSPQTTTKNTWNGMMRFYEIGWEGIQLSFMYTSMEWFHTLVIEEELPLKPRATYPRVIEGKRACPPFMCESPTTYRKYVEALRYPFKRGSRGLLTRFGASFDPDAFLTSLINSQLRNQFLQDV